MGIWQKWLGSWARWRNTQIKVNQTQVHEQMGHPVHNVSVLTLAFSRDFRTATLFLSLRRRYSSLFRSIFFLLIEVP